MAGKSEYISQQLKYDTAVPTPNIYLSKRNKGTYSQKDLNKNVYNSFIHIKQYL